MINNQILAKTLKRDKRSISRLLSLIESESDGYVEYLNLLYPKTGNAYRIGITGPPGAGKSTITNELTLKYLEQSKTVAIIAVDPTSPFTGGAVLGDRVRMNDIGMEESVYIRSMATRGSLGGLSSKTVDCADVLDAAGFDLIIFETVGVGQSELDIAKAADTTIVTLVPESGDSVQAMKAGLMEIADIFVVNKFDRPEGEKVITSLQAILGFKEMISKLFPPILQTIATENKGIAELHSAIENHRNIISADNFNRSKRFSNTKFRIKGIVERRLSEQLWNSNSLKELDLLTQKVINKEMSPYELAQKLIEEVT